MIRFFNPLKRPRLKCILEAFAMLGARCPVAEREEAGGSRCLPVSTDLDTVSSAFFESSFRR
jgi:hypothetical protein